MLCMSNIRNFTPTGWVAIFRTIKTLPGRAVEVDGWDGTTGAALVVDAEQGVRRPVTDFPNFSHLERADRVVAVLPGAGSTVRSSADWEQADSQPTEEVLMWLVASNGTLTPITVDKNANYGHGTPAELRSDPVGGDNA